MVWFSNSLNYRVKDFSKCFYIAINLFRDYNSLWVKELGDSIINKPSKFI
jgi:hypothetical protein